MHQPQSQPVHCQACTSISYSNDAFLRPTISSFHRSYPHSRLNKGCSSQAWQASSFPHERQTPDWLARNLSWITAASRRIALLVVRFRLEPLWRSTEVLAGEAASPCARAAAGRDRRWPRCSTCAAEFARRCSRPRRCRCADMAAPLAADPASPPMHKCTTPLC